LQGLCTEPTEGSTETPLCQILRSTQKIAAAEHRRTAHIPAGTSSGGRTQIQTPMQETSTVSGEKGQKPGKSTKFQYQHGGRLPQQEKKRKQQNIQNM